VLTGLFNYWGFAIGVAVLLILLATNKTVNGNRSYLYPLIPFSGKALLRMFIRPMKRD
jgi:stage V sporulation protein AF